MSQSLRNHFYTASPAPGRKQIKIMKKLKHAEKGYEFPMCTWGMRHGVQGLDFTSLCSFPPANVPPSAFLSLTLEVSRVFIYSRASLCKSTFHKSQSFSSISEQETEQDICFFFVTSKWLSYRSASSEGSSAFCRFQESVSPSLPLSLPHPLQQVPSLSSKRLIISSPPSLSSRRFI